MLHTLVLSNNVNMAVRIGFDAMIGIMSDAVWTSVHRRRGLDVRYLSRPFRVDENDPMVIGLVPMQEHHLAALRQHCDVEHRVDPALERMHRAHADAV